MGGGGGPGTESGVEFDVVRVILLVNVALSRPGGSNKMMQRPNPSL